MNAQTLPPPPAYISIAKDLIKRHEGFSSTLYLCTAKKQTIGYGHNLDARGISKRIAEELLNEDMSAFIQIANKYSWFNALDDVRKAVVVDMCFNLGSLDEFPKLRNALEAKNYQAAALEMQTSQWYSQVGVRAKNLVKIMVSGNTNGLE